jgi:tryptophanyl-tRNA synthetase
MSIVVSGMRPTGKLHIGHYFGALVNWIQLQDQKECYFLVADWHALTSDYEHTEKLSENTREMMADWLECGIDPNKATLLLQSQVKEHAELYLILSMFTPLGWLERNPTYKEQQQEIKDKDISNLGFFGYPVMQTADILVYKGAEVPVGKDQVPHLEISREIARRFNHLTGKQVFPEPKALLTPSAKILGTDGRKMSKSYGNSIFLSDDDKAIQTKIMGMATDPKRVRRQDPGNPEDCSLYPLHEVYSSKTTIEEVRKGCTTAGIGCVDCKKMLLPSLTEKVGEIRGRREAWISKPKKIDEILIEGSKKAQVLAAKTLNEVKDTLHVLRNK